MVSHDQSMTHGSGFSWHVYLFYKRNLLLAGIATSQGSDVRAPVLTPVPPQAASSAASASSSSSAMTLTSSSNAGHSQQALEARRHQQHLQQQLLQHQMMMSGHPNLPVSWWLCWAKSEPKAGFLTCCKRPIISCFLVGAATAVNLSNDAATTATASRPSLSSPRRSTANV